MTCGKLTILQGDWMERLRDVEPASVQTCVTSPPYWGLRDYKCDGQLGLEKTPQEYVQKLVAGFRLVCEALKDDGTLWLNLGDSYASAWACSRRNLIGNGSLENGKREARPNRISDGLKEKDLIGIPWRVAFALQEDGWYLRSDIIWSKPNPMPESVTDRPTKAHEYIFLLTKNAKYFYDYEAIKEESVTNDPRRPYGSKGAWEMDGRPEEQQHGGEPRCWNGSKFHTGKTMEHQQNRASVKRGGFNGKTQELPGREAFRAFTETRNKRSVWSVPSSPYKEAHFATYPPDLIKPCILAGSRPGDTVLDPFGGSGTTAAVAIELGRKAVTIELNPDYVKLIERRTDITAGLPL